MKFFVCQKKLNVADVEEARTILLNSFLNSRCDENLSNRYGVNTLVKYDNMKPHRSAVAGCEDDSESKSCDNSEGTLKTLIVVRFVHS